MQIAFHISYHFRLTRRGKSAIASPSNTIFPSTTIMLILIACGLSTLEIALNLKIIYIVPL